MVTAIYLQAETKEMLQALAAPGESFDALLQRLVLELLEARRAQEAPAPPALVPEGLFAPSPPAAAEL